MTGGGLRVGRLTKRFGARDRVVAVDRVDLEVAAGELLVLLGPSGCGKTTLLRCVAGLEDAQEGTIALGGRTVFDADGRFNLPTHRRDIGMVFQNYSLWPHMSVRQNVEYPLRARGCPAGERDRRVREILDVVQCAPLADRLPAMLSGGQQQRVALARALASRPAVMLLDEPLSNLDAVLRVELRAQLRAIHRELAFTGVYVTHDQVEAFNLGTRVAVMNAGRIEQIGAAREVYARPASDYVARFLGIRNCLALGPDGAWSSAAARLAGDLRIAARPAGALALFVRPEELRLAPEAARTAPGPAELCLSGGRVLDMLYAGGTVDVVIRFGEADLVAAVPAAGARFKAGDAVCARFDRDAALIYADGALVGR